jgi:predicted anti-sigma-YlaC factor YlaD
MPAADRLHSPTPEEIMAYLDGETPPADRAAIEAHLAACKECEMVADNFRRVSQQAAEWAVEPAPAMRVPGGPAGPPQRARLLAWRPSRMVLAGLSAAAAVLLVISLSFNTRRGPAIVAEMPARPMAPSSAPAVIAGEGSSGGRRAELGQANAPAAFSGVMQDKAAAQGLRTPAVIRTASLHVVAKEFNGVRAAVEALVAQAGGFIDQMSVTGDTSTARTLHGTLRVPGDRLPDVLTRLRQLGQVVEDTQGSQDVTDQIVDLDARLVSARATEQRLTELLRTRTGKLSDVLEVERELTRVRLDIERLVAEKTNVGRRVSYATIGLTVAEERKAGLDAGPLSLTTRIRIAAADGLESALESVALMMLFLLRAGPTLLLWGVAAAIVWTVSRRLRRRSA